VNTTTATIRIEMKEWQNCLLWVVTLACAAARQQNRTACQDGLT